MNKPNSRSTAYYFSYVAREPSTDVRVANNLYPVLDISGLHRLAQPSPVHNKDRFIKNKYNIQNMFRIVTHNNTCIVYLDIHTTRLRATSHVLTQQYNIVL